MRAAVPKRGRYGKGNKLLVKFEVTLQNPGGRESRRQAQAA